MGSRFSGLGFRGLFSGVGFSALSGCVSEGYIRIIF